VTVTVTVTVFKLPVTPRPSESEPRRPGPVTVTPARVTRAVRLGTQLGTTHGHGSCRGACGRSLSPGPVPSDRRAVTVTVKATGPRPGPAGGRPGPSGHHHDEAMMPPRPGPSFSRVRVTAPGQSRCARGSGPGSDPSHGHVEDLDQSISEPLTDILTAQAATMS
jgi:hypothetical protein